MCVCLLPASGLQAHLSISCSGGLAVFSLYFPYSFPRCLRFHQAAERHWQEPQNRREGREGTPFWFQLLSACDSSRGWMRQRPPAPLRAPSTSRPASSQRSVTTVWCAPPSWWPLSVKIQVSAVRISSWERRGSGSPTFPFCVPSAGGCHPPFPHLWAAAEPPLGKPTGPYSWLLTGPRYNT